MPLTTWLPPHVAGRTGFEPVIAGLKCEEIPTSDSRLIYKLREEIGGMSLYGNQSINLSGVTHPSASLVFF